MIKRLIGLLAAAATIAILVFAVMNRDKYTSMLSGHAAPQTAAPAVTPAPVQRTAPQSTPASAADSLAFGQE